MMLYQKDLFEEALIKPMGHGRAELFIVSGFASSALAFRHFFEHKGRFSKKDSLSINLIVGMVPCFHIRPEDHQAFKALSSTKNFSCSYVAKRPCIHSKVYSWFIDNKPTVGFVGSANYSQTAFNNRQGEVLLEADPIRCKDYYDHILKSSIACEEVPQGSGLISTTKDGSGGAKTQTTQSTPLDGKSIKISFLDRSDNLPMVSGLNWGQGPTRAKAKREPNQAYLKIPKKDVDFGFFPLDGDHFLLKWDDGKILVCRLQQQNNKALTTPHDNSEIGRYIRSRVGSKTGVNLTDQLVTKQHLMAYGRSDVTYTKIDSHTFEADFSV